MSKYLKVKSLNETKNKGFTLGKEYELTEVEDPYAYGSVISDDGIEYYIYQEDDEIFTYSRADVHHVTGVKIAFFDVIEK